MNKDLLLIIFTVLLIVLLIAIVKLKSIYDSKITVLNIANNFLTSDLVKQEKAYNKKEGSEKELLKITDDLQNRNNELKKLLKDSLEKEKIQTQKHKDFKKFLKDHIYFSDPTSKDIIQNVKVKTLIDEEGNITDVNFTCRRKLQSGGYGDVPVDINFK